MIEGVNRQIIDRLEAQQALDPCSREDLEAALGSPDQQTRCMASLKAVTAIWKSFPGLGIPPVLDLVLKAEHGKDATSGQRDHVVHTLQVYLLGLDLLHGLPSLSLKLQRNGSFPDLKRKWAIASLAHDQGYLLDQDDLNETPMGIRSLLDDPLSGLDTLDSGYLSRFRNYLAFTGGPSEFVEQLRKDHDLDILAELSSNSLLPIGTLGESEAPLVSYYEFSRTADVATERDHGMASVLLVQQLHRRLREQLSSIDWNSIKDEDKRSPSYNTLFSLDKELASAVSSVDEGCLAIALHNIHNDLKRSELKLASALHELQLSAFRLSLQDTSLAWFLSFCDELQIWNRPATDMLNLGTQFVDPKDLSLDYRDEYAWLSFKKEEGELSKSGMSPYWTLRRSLTQYLDEGDLNGVLRQGPIPETATPSQDIGPSGSISSTTLGDQNYTNMGSISSKTHTEEMVSWKIQNRRLLYPKLQPVCVLYTGGSVGMVHEDPKDHRTPLKTEHLDRVLPHLRNLHRLGFDIDFYETPEPLDSSNIQPHDWVEIGHVIELLYPYYQGFVILHGTDTMTYTASALSFMFENLEKPIILTGAERPLSEPETDAEYNIMRALRLSAPSSIENRIIPEVCLFFGTRLLRGNRSKKTHALSFNGFDSPNCDRIGSVEDKITINWPIVRDRVFERRGAQMKFTPYLDERVAIYEIFPGEASCLDTLEYLLLESPVRGLILKTYGTGNAPTVPRRFLDIIRESVQEKGKVIVNLTHCLSGQVEVRLFETNARLFELGVINGGDMTVEAAFTKLMVLLAKYATGDDQVEYETVKRNMQMDWCGELRFSTHNVGYPVADGECTVAYGSPFLGQAVPMRDVESQNIDHAFIRVNGLTLNSPPETDIILRIFLQCFQANNDMDAEIERKHLVKEVRRKWEGGKLTFNIDATSKAKELCNGRDMAMQIVSLGSGNIAIEDFELSIFTEDPKGR